MPGMLVYFCQVAEPQHLHLLFAVSVGIELGKLHEHQVKAVNRLLRMLHMNQPVVMAEAGAELIDLPLRPYVIVFPLFSFIRVQGISGGENNHPLSFKRI